MRMDPIDSFIWILGPHLVELFGENQECGLGEVSVLLEWVLGVSKDTISSELSLSFGYVPG